MDKKRAAIVASAGVGLLVSALFLHRMRRNRSACPSDSSESEVKAVVVAPEIPKRLRSVNHAADSA